MGIYKKKTRKHAFDQESDQERKKEREKNTPRKRSRKKDKNENCQEKKKENTISTKKATIKKYFFYDRFLLSVSWSRACFLSFFITFLFSFINSHLCVDEDPCCRCVTERSEGERGKTLLMET